MIEKKKTNMVTFRASENDVLEFLEDQKSRGVNISELINEAIRINGDDAMLKILEREADIAQSKLESAKANQSIVDRVASEALNRSVADALKHPVKDEAELAAYGKKKAEKRVHRHSPVQTVRAGKPTSET